MEFQAQEWFIDDVKLGDIVDLTIGRTKIGGRPRTYEIAQLGITIALDIEVERGIRVGAVRGSDMSQVFVDWSDVILYSTESKAVKLLSFFWQGVSFEENVTIALGQGEILVFYRDGYRSFDYPNNFDIESITVHSEDIVVNFSHGEQERFKKLESGGESS